MSALARTHARAPQRLFNVGGVASDFRRELATTSVSRAAVLVACMWAAPGGLAAGKFELELELDFDSRVVL